MIPKNGNPILWEELTWKDVDKLTKTMNMAIIPTAACEQHGPHLPLAVDTIDCYEVAKRVSAKTGVPVVPPLTYGCSQSQAVDEDDYETFFEYRMDQYSKSGVVGRGATKSTPELGEKLFTMVVDALVPMVNNALNEERSKSKSAIYENHNNNNNDKSKTNPSPSKGKRKVHNDYNIDFENSNSGNLKKKAK